MKMNVFVRDDVLPSWWANSIQEHIAGLIANLRLTLANATTVRAAAVSGDSNDVQASVGIDGAWRRASVNVDRAHPGGAAGKYDIFVTAKNNSIVAVPLPGTDTTDYLFALAIVATGGTPAIVPGTVDIFRKVGECWWNGAAITRLEPWTSDRRPGSDALVAGTPLASIPPLTIVGQPGQTSLMTAGVNNTGDDRLDLSGAGQLKLPVQGVTGGLLIGGDASLYRSAAGELTVGSDLAVLDDVSIVGDLNVSGVPTGPTPAADTNTTRLATTAFVIGQASAVAPQPVGTAAVGTSLRYARADHVHAVPVQLDPLIVTVEGEVRVPVGNFDVIPPMIMHVAAGRTQKITAVKGITGVGNVTYKITKNGVDQVTGLSATPTQSSVDIADITVVDGDRVQIVVTGIFSTPQNMGLSLARETA